MSLLRLSRWPGLCLLLALPLGAGTAIRQASAQPISIRTSPPSPIAVEPTPILHLQDIGKGVAVLDGPWQFHAGDDTAWASTTLDDSRWDKITADQPWGAQEGHQGYTGFAWYRRHLTLTPAHGAGPQFALLIRHIDDAYEIYWNGVLVGSNGRMPPHPAWYNDQAAQTFGLPIPLDATSDGVPRPNDADVLAIRVWKAPLFSYDTGDQGGFLVPPEIGSPDAIAAHKADLDYRWLRGRQFTFALDCLYALVALLCLLAWLRDRKHWLLLWMVGFSLAPLAILILDGLRLPWPFALSLGLQQPMYSLEDISLWFILLWVLELHDVGRLRRITWILAIVNLASTILDGTVVIFGWASTWSRLAQPSQLLDSIFTITLTLTEVLPLVLVLIAVALRRHLEPARWFVGITAFLTVMTSVLQVGLSQGSRFTHWTFAERISGPLFTINGNPIAAYTLFRTLLVFALIYAVYRYYVETGRRRGELEQEFKSARELQQVLIPETPPSVPGFTLTGAYRPAQEVGGDFFQIIPLEGGATLVILGDVSGKGLKAAMAVAMIVGAVRALAATHSDPAPLLTELNKSLYGRLQGGFATCIALRLEANGYCEIASAGHPSPFVNGREITLSGALPLGLAPSAEYEEFVLHLKVDEQLALYTDGLLEARNQAGELLSFDRLKAVFAAKPTAEEATEVAVNFGQDDDITVLTLTRRPPNFIEPQDPMYAANHTIRLYPAG
jgi:hypothetical protein